MARVTNQARGLSSAAGVSLGLHASLLGALALARYDAPPAGPVAQAPFEAQLVAGNELSPGDEVSLLESVAGAERLAVDLRDAPEGESARDVVTSRSPRTGVSLDPRAPAPDTGNGAGRRLDPAFRRDTSTLRSRLTDGASVYQPSRLETGARASSPQAMRHERLTGVGDSTRTAEPAPGHELSPEDGAASQEPPPLSAGPRGARATDSDERFRATGPLDVASGPRSFDVEEPGPAADRLTLRAASAERHPGITDFSAAATPGPADSAEGRGPANTPGAVARSSTGTAPALYGAPDAAETGVDLEMRSRERRYARYVQEINRRVGAGVEFPRALALRLEQGETVVRFVVRPDGRLEGGVKVSKSSGFDEFDAAALRAVQKAAPFPPMLGALPHPLAVSMPIAFENPLIR